MTSASYVAPKLDSLHSKCTEDIVEPLIQQMSHQKYNGISSPADFPSSADVLLRIEGDYFF